MENHLEEEVSRALAYYVTAYREAGVLSRRVVVSDMFDEMKQLASHKEIRKLLESQPSTGRQMKALYEDKTFMERGFLIKGSEEDKIRGLISLLLPVFDQSFSIVVLHCLTGLHALVNLKDYFNDFDRAFDIYSTCCLAHLLTVGDLTYNESVEAVSTPDWNEIISQCLSLTDVHTIKFTYSCHELYQRYGMEELKRSAYLKMSGK